MNNNEIYFDVCVLLSLVAANYQKGFYCKMHYQ